MFDFMTTPLSLFSSNLQTDEPVETKVWKKTSSEDTRSDSSMNVSFGIGSLDWSRFQTGNKIFRKTTPPSVNICYT